MMPSNLVKTPHDERLWEKAKEIVRKQYGKTEKDGESYWKLVVGVYKQAGGHKEEEKVEKSMEAKESAQAEQEEQPNETLPQVPAQELQAEAPEVYPDSIHQSIADFRALIDEWRKSGQ